MPSLLFVSFFHNFNHFLVICNLMVRFPLGSGNVCFDKCLYFRYEDVECENTDLRIVPKWNIDMAYWELNIHWTTSCLCEPAYKSSCRFYSSGTESMAPAARKSGRKILRRVISAHFLIFFFFFFFLSLYSGDLFFLSFPKFYTHFGSSYNLLTARTHTHIHIFCAHIN